MSKIIQVLQDQRRLPPFDEQRRQPLKHQLVWEWRWQFRSWIFSIVKRTVFLRWRICKEMKKEQHHQKSILDVEGQVERNLSNVSTKPDHWGKSDWLTNERQCPEDEHNSWTENSSLSVDHRDNDYQNSSYQADKWWKCVLNLQCSIFYQPDDLNCW